MEGKRVEALFNYVDKFSKEILFIQIGFLLIIFAVFIWVWLYNRRRYHHLKHQIPASVVKNYLDSIIQNSTALKSSLFRGGGLDVDSSSVPSVLSFKDLAQGMSSAALSSGSESEELNSKNAEIMRLRSELEVKNNVIRDLEKELTSFKGELKARDQRIEELEKIIEDLRASGGSQDSSSDEALLSELDEAKRERDELRNRLAEYAIIEDDLANLKRLQQENEQLKRSLGEGASEESYSEEESFEMPNDEIGMDEIPSAERDTDLGIDEDELQAMEDALDSPSEEDETFDTELTDALEEEVLEEDSESQDDEASEATIEAKSDEEESKEEEPQEKSPEDLLSEFEKMLG